MKVILRDDDLNYFSTPADIEWYYKDWMYNVLFATVPFVAPKREKFGNYFSIGDVKDDAFFSIGNNECLVQYVNKKNKYFLGLHGVTHARNGNKFEFEVNRSKEYIELGMQEIEKTFVNSSRIFIPPHDRINAYNLTLMSELALPVIKSYGLQQFDGSVNGIMNYIYQIGHVLKGNRSYPITHPLKFKNIPVFFSIRLIDDYSLIEDKLKFALKNNTHLCITNHVHMRTQSRLDNLMRIQDWVYKNKVDMVSPEEFVRVGI